MDSIADMVGFRANGSLRLLATRGFEFTISDGSKTQKVVGKGFDKKGHYQMQIFPQIANG